MYIFKCVCERTNDLYPALPWRGTREFFPWEFFPDWAQAFSMCIKKKFSRFSSLMIDEFELLVYVYVCVCVCVYVCVCVCASSVCCTTWNLTFSQNVYSLHNLPYSITKELNLRNLGYSKNKTKLWSGTVPLKKARDTIHYIPLVYPIKIPVVMSHMWMRH